MELKGIIPAMVTPLNEDNTINNEATTELVEHLIRSGVHGLFILGTNGEFYALTEEQKLRLCQIVVKAVDGRIPVYAGAGAISTEMTIDLANKMKKMGIDAVSVITPFLIQLRQEEVYLHYQQIAEEVDLPIVLYNIPKNTGINIEPETLSKLSRYQNIVGIKDSSGNFENLKQYIEVTKNSSIKVLVGSDSLILSSLKAGAVGAVAATANVLTKTDLGIYRLFLENRLSDAQTLQESIDEFRRVLKFNSVPSVLKYAVRLKGFDVGKPCLPVREKLTLAQKEEIKKVMQGYKSIERFEGDFFEET